MSQQQFWNKKFLRDGYLYGKEPNAFLKSCYNNFTKSQRVLCVGEGEGRNAVFLAKKGYDVGAIDASDIGLKKLEEWAAAENVKVKTKCTDINEWTPDKEYGAIVMTFVHLSLNELEELFEKLESALKDKGFIVVEVFSKRQLNNSSGGPKDLELLYDVSDFEKCVKHSMIHKLEEVEVELDEGKGHQGKASVIRMITQRM